MAEIVFDATTAAPVQPYSCGECRVRKSKCNRRVPCSNCQHKKLSCVYGHTRKPKRQKRRHMNSRIADPPSSAGTDCQDDAIDTNVSWNHSGDDHDFQNIFGSIAMGTRSPDLDLDAAIAALPASEWTLAWPEMGLEEAGPQILELPFPELQIKNTICRYLYQIHPSTPFFSASFLLDGVKNHRHRTDRAFAAMVVALCAFTNSHFGDDSLPISPMDSISQALRLYQDPDLGEAPSVESLVACMFISGALWQLGKHAAAWLRLQEAINLAKLLRLSELEYDNVLDASSWDNTARIYLGLSVMDRVYASSFPHSPSLPPVPSSLLQRFSEKGLAAQTVESFNESRHDSALRLLVHFFGCIDRGLASCLRGECGSVFGFPSSCTRLSHEKAVQILRDAANIDIDAWRHLEDVPFDPTTPTLKAKLEAVGMTVGVSSNENEHADVLLTCYWVQHRLWNLALIHGYIGSSEEVDCPELSFKYCVELSARALGLLKKFSILSWESHEQGVAEKCFGIASIFLIAATQLTEQDMTRHSSQRRRNPCTLPFGSTSNAGIVPPRPSHTAEEDLLEIANGFMGFFALFKGGRHPYHKEYMSALHSFMESMRIYCHSGA
ncbi:hypothetical protein BJY00DRAFT_141976 [Aspergillus carlsbadensis]|nr:hypothetical protein BJY00DRAFT_141976 [Aspergillus carlsbadensis]